MSLALVKHRLPPFWDGAAVEWGKFEDVVVRICPPPKADPCDCGSTRNRLMASGRREPSAGATVPSTRRKLGRFGRWVFLPTVVQAGPVVDLVALRCPDCHLDEVWDMRADEWWTLDDSDYGSTGSTRPLVREWSSGLFDLLPASTSQAGS